MQREESTLFAILEPGARALGFELIAVELAGSGRNTVLRAYIDGPEGVTVDDCAEVSHQLSAILDVEDPISGHYTLEVSSPGLDRPLVKAAHFEQVVGQNVRLRLQEPVDGRRKFTGRLLSVKEDRISVDVDGEQYELPLGQVERARLVPKF